MHRSPERNSRVRALTTGVPLALAGSLAITVGADAAVAAEYTVEPGDTVSGIAARHGLRTADVLQANGLGWSTTIYPGQTLSVGSAPVAAPAAAAPATPASSHTVAAGDTVSGIARAAGVSTAAVLEANGLTESSIIYPGETLIVPAPTPSMTPAVAATPSAAGLDAEQTGNALTIIRVGRELGVSDRGIAIALGTAMQESWLRNLDWGDRDSLGLFQQRPSMGWGSAEQVRDTARATRAFFGGSGDPNGTLTRGLLDIPGWESMTFADAAQAVQISAFPDRYAQWEQPAAGWLAALG
jgi:N-acetylmuramoyl-L-alanine amidase